MVDNYTIKDVTKDLGFLLSLTKIFGPDDKDFWMDLVTKERFAYSLGGDDAKKEIANFQDPMPQGDYYFFNPYSEGLGKKTPASELFYRLARVGLNINLGKAVMYLASDILAGKQATEGGGEYRHSHVVTRMSAVRIDRKQTLYDVMDEKMVGEFKELFDRLKEECLFVPYMKAQMRSIVTCAALQDADWDEKFGKDMRKRTLAAFKVALMGVLGITKPEELDQFTVTYDREWKSAPRIHTNVSVYLNLYMRFNDILADAFGTDGVSSTFNEIDLGELQAVIERMPLAYAIAKHMIQPAIKVAPVSAATADTSGLRISNDPGVSRTGSVGRFPGPEIVDVNGRRVGQSTGGFTISNTPSTSRFPPQLVSDAPVDPFAPLTRQSPSMSFGSGGFGRGGSMFGGSSFGGGFGGSSGGLDFTPSTTFGNPSGRRGYFG